MPIIYDIETLSGDAISSNDGIFMLDGSDKKMSNSGSNKVELVDSFLQPIKIESDLKFLNLIVDTNTDANLTLEIFTTGSNSKFAFTDDLEFSKTFSTATDIFLTETEINRVSSEIDSLSYLSISNSEHSFQRTLDPIHFERKVSSLICSNLSSLQAHLIDLFYDDYADFNTAEKEANKKINMFFNNASASPRSNFNIVDLFPINSLSDVEPSERFFLNEGVVVENINGYINENYNYMVDTLAKSLNTTQSFVNLEIAKKLKSGIFINHFFDNSSFVESFIDEFNSSIDSNIVGQNYLLLLNASSDVKILSVNSFDFAGSTIQSQSQIILSESSQENIFTESLSKVIGFLPDGSPVTASLSLFLSDGAEVKHITLDKFSEESLNQNYSLVGSVRERGFYLSEDERFEIIYAVTGSSPSVDSITFDQNSEEYTVTLANLDGGFSYEIEFDNILGSTYNTSGTITGIKTDSQTLPISNNFKISLIETGQNQSASFKLLESKSESLNDPQSSSEFSFGDIKFLRSDELIDPLQAIDPSWIIRSSDVRKNFQAGVAPSIETISGESYFVMNINNTAGLIFDIQAATFNFQYEAIETSIKGSDETIVRKFKINETPYNFFRISSFFSEEKDLFSYPLQAPESISPLGLNEGWLNLSTNLTENPIIIQSGVEYTGDISISGFSMLFEFKNTIPGNSYYKILPEFIQFDSDPNVYLISGSGLGYNVASNGVFFTSEYSSYTAAVPYSISGASDDAIGIGQTVDLGFSENEPLYFEKSDIRISIPADTTTGMWTPPTP